jgi:hypothetical protein
MKGGPSDEAIEEAFKMTGLYGVFQLGVEWERLRGERVRAAAQRTAIVSAALNKKLADGPGEDSNG